MAYTLYPDNGLTRSGAVTHARGDYQRRLLDGREPWTGPGGPWHDGAVASRDRLLARLRGAGYRCAPALRCSMAISRDAIDRANWLADHAVEAVA